LIEGSFLKNLTYTLPDNEFQRLQALHEYDLLDTPPEEEFDRLTEIAERELDVDVAAITFLDDDRQFLKSATGTEITETPRESSFCTYTILSEELTIIPDSRKDDRLDKNHLSLEGNEVRAYAGAPLVTEDGNQLGSFCLMSFQPRKFDSDELDLLKLLRDQTLALINSRHHEKQLRKLAHYDPITGFLKRQLFKEELQETLWNVSDPAHTIAIGHLDLTRFDRVTDTLGYGQGSRYCSRSNQESDARFLIENQSPRR
jgi:GAF domain-containing protein